MTQPGLAVAPLCTVVLTSIVEPGLKFACDPQQSPTRMNSIPGQPLPRLRMLPMVAALALKPPTNIVTVSLPLALALAPKRRLVRREIGF
jgi:hypothetical protein